MRWLLTIVVISSLASSMLLYAQCNKYHYVKKGEYLGSIAKDLKLKYPNKVALKIASINDIKNPNYISIGDKICVDKELLFPPKQECTPAPTPVATPTIKDVEQTQTIKQPEVEDKSDKEVLTGFYLAPFLSYSRIDAVDNSNNAKGTVLSKADYGTEFKIMQLWENYFTSELIFQAERKSYITNSSRTFTDHGGSVINFGAGIGVRPFSRLEFRLKALYGDELYLRAPNVQSLTIDSTKTLKADIAIYFDIMRSRFASTYIGVGTRIIKGGSIGGIGSEAYDIKTGYGYFGTFCLKHKFKRVILEESFTYESMTKNTQLFNQVHMAAYIKGGIIFLF
jgi:hypothetical protein